MSTHVGLEGERGHSWEDKTKILGYFFKKLTKSLIDRDKSIKGLWANIGQFAKIYQCIFTWQ